MTQDPYLAEVFPEPPLVTYTRPKNIRDLLIRAKLPSKTRQRRKIPGMKRCKENCSICPYVNSCKSVKSTYTGRHFHLPGHQKSHMSITVLEKLYTDDTAYRKRRESHYIELFNLKYKGMNRRR